jgi:hypothetical protein
MSCCISSQVTSSTSSASAAICRCCNSFIWVSYDLELELDAAPEPPESELSGLRSASGSASS